ncbi:hypothetical protein [Methylocystis sp. SC2]|uniref:hypothetical protein n=1 Tax=Methylocystis sp. (strain SC2) TaxID=187303 RepID=UPI001FCA5EF6|nr:hypothetical protein [Methylocystis sp. SC2]
MTRPKNATRMGMTTPLITIITMGMITITTTVIIMAMNITMIIMTMAWRVMAMSRSITARD